MRIAALTSLFLIGATSLVSAAPVREESAERISYNDRRGPKTVKPPAEPGWIELASATPASHGKELIDVAADLGAVTQLRLTGVSGRPGIRAVRVEYKDGNHRSFEVEKILTGKRRTAVVDLRGARAISMIIVVTDRDSPGSYTVEGDTSAPAVAVR
jgi:hypothetical protein